MATTQNQSLRSRIGFAVRHSCPTDAMVTEIERRLLIKDKDAARLEPRPFGVLIRKIVAEMTADPDCSY